MVERDIVEHGAVELQNIVPAIVVVIEKLRGHAAQQHRFVTDARAECLIGKSAVMAVAIETVQFEVEMGNVKIHPPIAVDVGGVNAHARLVSTIFAGRHARDQGDVFKRSIVLVNEKKIRPGVIGDGDIGPAVIVEVGEHHAHSFCLGLAHAGGVTHIGESSVMIVVIDLDALAFVIAGMTVRAIAGPPLTTPDVILRIPIDVIGDDKI